MHLTLHALAIQRQKVEHLDNEMHDEQKCNFQNEIKNFGVILPENSKFKYQGDYKSDSHEMSDRNDKFSTFSLSIWVMIFRRETIETRLSEN